ncbi:MAG: sodium:solute symporter family protein [Candidatus Hydrogenedentales bacterium]|jgi:SSS family solute:Na+ symporter
MENAAQGSLQRPDFFMIAGYFVLMLAIGVYFYRYMKRMKDYFSGGSAIPWWLSGVSFYMTSFSVAAFVFYPSICYRYGWVGVTLLWVAVPATLFSVLLFAKRWRRARIDSPVEYLETRYNPLLRQIFAWQGIPVRMIDDGIKLFATGKFISICTGVNINYSILGAGGIMLIYTFMGGLWAVMVTDFVQFVVLTAGLLVILPLSLQQAGGLSQVFTNSPEGFFKMTSDEFSWTYVIPLIMLYSLAWSSINWALIQRYYCVPKERDALKVGWMVVALYIVGPPLMFFPALAARQFIPTLQDAGDIYPILCAKLLPAGMLGLAIAAMFAATMSTLSGDYNACAGVLTNDVYRRLFRPKASQRELVTVGRLMTLLVGVVALGTALVLARGRAESMFRIMVTLFGVATAPVAVPMLLGLLSRRYTGRSAVIGFLCGTVVGLLLFALSFYKSPLSLAGISWVPESEEFLLGGLKIKLEIAMFLSTAIITYALMELTSWLFPAQSDELERAKAFLTRLEVPIGKLPEDQEHEDAGGAAIMSPFRIVGVCVAVIGLMMLALVPWIHEATPRMLDIILGSILLLTGVFMAWNSKRDLIETKS